MRFNPFSRDYTRSAAARGRRDALPLLSVDAAEMIRDAVEVDVVQLDPLEHHRKGVSRVMRSAEAQALRLPGGTGHDVPLPSVGTEGLPAVGMNIGDREPGQRN